MPVISYLRVSDRHQVTGDGFDRQRDTIERWRRSKDPEPTLIQEFLEEGHTGTDFERPVLGELLDYCRGWEHQRIIDAGNGNEDIGPLVVVVERSDRLARDNLVSELILQEFRRLGVRVIDCEADLDLTHDDDPSKVLIRQILQAVAQFEKSSIVKKLRRARERKKAKTGRCEGQKPFGHYPDEKPTLDVILRMAAEGDTASQIAYVLNQPHNLERHRPRRGSRWNRGTVYKIIKSHHPA